MKKILFPFAKIAIFYVLVGFIMRVIFMLLPITNQMFFLEDYVKIFLLGAGNDFCLSILIFFFLWLYLVFLSDKKYRTPWGYSILSFWIVVLAYLCFFPIGIREYGSGFLMILRILVGIKVISFTCLLFLPGLRKKWRYSTYSSLLFLYTFFIIFNAVSEFLFWNEYGARYNFIAIKYLNYTSAEIKNVLEAYPVVPMLSILILISLLVTVFFVRKTGKYFSEFPNFRIKLWSSLAYAGVLVGALLILDLNEKQENSDNVFVNELQANGLVKFYKAYKKETTSTSNTKELYAGSVYKKEDFEDKKEKEKAYLNSENKIISIIKDSISQFSKSKSSDNIE